MAWEWSHTVEAYENVHDNIRDLKRGKLETIWAEWEAWDGNTNSTTGFDIKKYQVAQAKVKTLPDDILADAIWEKVTELRTCENGGHLAWLCPFGCDCHMAAFDYQCKD
jgi:hypothetical protein